MDRNIGTSGVNRVVITPASHGAKLIQNPRYASNPKFVSCPDELMQKISLGKNLLGWEQRMSTKQHYEKLRCEGHNIPGRGAYTDEELKKPSVEILSSSFSNRSDNGAINCGEEQALMFSENGLVWSVIHAYSSHHHLILRPEDLWFAILTQFSTYIDAHAEEFRHVFVAHEGKKELVVKQAANRYTADYRYLTNGLGHLIQENILDSDFREWIMPAFSTTTKDDKVVASVLMMASMQKYFEYTMQLMCGLPSVTLLGEQGDYEQMLAKLDRLERYGDEPTQFAALLKPVVSRLIRTFDNPSAPAVLDFWQRIAHVGRFGSGSKEYSGWITAFCFWDRNGKRIDRTSRQSSFSSRHGEGPVTQAELKLDGVRYGTIADKNVPSGYAKVPVKIDDNGQIFAAEMTAGSVGIACSSSGQEMEDGTLGLDTMQPAVAWWIAIG